MTSVRNRLSASVDGRLLEAGRTAVAEGRAPNLSAWVNDALALQVEHDRRMRALDEFLERYEAENGPISDDEMRDAVRRVRSRAVIVRTPDMAPVPDRVPAPGRAPAPGRRRRAR